MQQQDLFELYQLPPLDRVPPDSPTYATLKSAKVLRYAEQMPVSFSMITAPEYYLNTLRHDILLQLPQDYGLAEHYFTGETASELNAFVETLTLPAKVILHTTTLTIDPSVLLKTGLWLQGNATVLVADAIDNAVIGENCTHFALQGVSIHCARVNAVLLLNCRQGVLRNLTIVAGDDYGIILRQQTSYVAIEHSRFVGTQRSGIMVHDGAHHNFISHCQVTGVQHSSNWAAGIVITALEATSLYTTRDAFETNYFYPNNLEVHLPSVPHQNIVENCSVHNNRSSGIYVDGGNGNVVFNNMLELNDKEGLCLDFYSAVNIVLNNTLNNNGHRCFQSDHALEIDCVKEFGRLSDGSSCAKLPNISLDNTGLNIIMKNTISYAGGDGIKMVRAAFKNLVLLNVITDNNQGENFRFNFSGILLGSAGCEIENDSSGLDRLPSIENMLFANMIIGKHTFGIVYDGGSIYNDTIDNFVMKQNLASVLENASPNSMVGNNFMPAEARIDSLPEELVTTEPPPELVIPESEALSSNVTASHASGVKEIAQAIFRRFN